MLFKKPRHRIFDYTPRFYKPEQDENEKRKRKLGFRRNITQKRKKQNPVVWGIFVIIMIIIYLKFSGSL